jgi:hypothetical protein
MAILLRNTDGTYASECALCGRVLTDPVFATSHFLPDPSHDLHAFSDAAMHWGCYAAWPEQARFAGLYFDCHAGATQNDFWPVLHRSERTILRYGVMVHEFSVILRASGTDVRVREDDWESWLGGGWRASSAHPLEAGAIEGALAELRAVEF